MKIDGISWNIEAINKMTEREFVFRHMGIRRDLPDDERRAYLQGIYVKIVPQTAENAAVVKPEKVAKKKGKA